MTSNPPPSNPEQPSPDDPDKRTGPLAEERCRCVDFKEWDDEDLTADKRDDDAELTFEWTIKQRLHRLDGFPVTRPMAASFSHKVDLTSLDRNLKGGLGVMVDDMAAGVLAGAFLWLSVELLSFFTN